MPCRSCVRPRPSRASARCRRTHLPPSYVSQSLRFPRPVYVGDCVAARIEVVDVYARRRWLRCNTTACVGEEVVVDGEALVAL